MEHPHCHSCNCLDTQVKTSHIYWSFMKCFSLATTCSTLWFAPINHMPMALLLMMSHANLMQTACTASTNLHIPLSLSSAVSVFNMLTPTSANLKTLSCIVMTSSAPWNLNSPSFVAMEETYKVSRLNSQQGDVNFIANMNLFNT